MTTNILYDAGVRLYGTGIRVAAWFDPKARQWTEGRKGLFEEIEKELRQRRGDHKLIWFHCASLGEFEQGRPLIEALKTAYPAYQIFLTFFSPSGYLIRKNYAFADYVFYLPLDTPANARRMAVLVRPAMAIFVKYEFWARTLEALRLQGIPLFLISGIFRKEQIFFKPYGGFFVGTLQNFTYFFVQNPSSLEALRSIGFQNAEVAGDTRVDRVASIGGEEKDLSAVKAFAPDGVFLVCGSSWEPEEKIAAEYLKIAAASGEKCKTIIAPHDVAETHLTRLESFLSVPFIRYSEAVKIVAVNPAEAHLLLKEYEVLLIDCIGLLSSLYRLGRIAFIGGGFGKGIHSILEPASAGIPVIFGPRYQKFEEATQLIADGGAFSIRNFQEFEAALKALEGKEQYQKSADAAIGYINRQKGATERILMYLRAYLTN